MSAHTPGPWAWYNPDDPCHSNLMSLRGPVITHNTYEGLWFSIGEPKIDMANAMLIAAAPELLEALMGVVRVADRETVEFIAARAAIAKATGEA